MLTSSGEVSNQDLVGKLPAAGTSLLVDAAPVLRRLQPWRIGERIRWIEWVAWVVAALSAVGALALSADRRRTLHHLGLGVVGAGLAVVLLTRIAPRAAADRIDDPDLAQAVSAATSRFVSDLGVLGLWVVAIGAVVAAAASAAGLPHVARDLRRLAPRFEQWASMSRLSQTVLGIGLAVLGGLVIAAHETLLPILLLALGAFLAYAGLVLAFTGLLGPARAADDAAVERARRQRAEHVVLLSASLVLLAVLAVGLVTTVASARAGARRAAELRCNGASALCDRRLDQVVVPRLPQLHVRGERAGLALRREPHRHPGPALEYGVRALLVKSALRHPDRRGGRRPRAGRHRQGVGDPPTTSRTRSAELTPAAVARAEQLEATVRPGDPAHRRLPVPRLLLARRREALDDPPPDPPLPRPQPARGRHAVHRRLRVAGGHRGGVRAGEAARPRLDLRHDQPPPTASAR